MTLRTPNPLTNTTTTLDLRRIKEHLAILQQQISTGQRIVRLGDDPTGAALIVDFQSSIDRNAQYVKQADSAASFLQETESSLNGVNTAMLRLLELGTQALGDTTGNGGHAALAPEVDGIRTNLLSIANTQQQGKYLFAGTQTTTPPFSGPAAGPITYAGDSNSIVLDVSVSAKVTTNMPGDAVFFGAGGQGSATDLFAQVTALRDALTAPTYVYANVQTAVNNLKSIFTGLQSKFTDLGGRQAALDQLKSTVGDFNVSLQSIQDTYAAVDYPQAISDYQREGTAQQAALSVLGKSNAQNLFDYIT